MLDYIDIDNWEPRLTAALAPLVPQPVKSTLQTESLEYYEDYLDRLLELTDREAVIETALAFIRSETITGYHGSRLTDEDISSIRSSGLIPLNVENRRHRLVRALSPHPRWYEVANGLDPAIEEYKKATSAGRRESQVWLTLSKVSLTKRTKEYLKYGSEFDCQIARALLGDDGLKLLARDGNPIVVRVAVSGAISLNAAHLFRSIESFLAKGEAPLIVREFLGAWSFRLARRGNQSSNDPFGFNIVFFDPIPPDWIIDLEPWPDQFE